MPGRGKEAAHAVCTVLSLALLAASCGEPLATPAPAFVAVDGSMDMVELVTALAAGYESAVASVRFEVEGHGSTYGVTALDRGELEVAMVSWLPDELGASWQATTIARDGVAVIVHPSNLLGGVGLLQLQDLFAGQAYDWSAVGGRVGLGPVQPVSREEGSGVRAAFESLVMDGKEVTPRAALVTSPQAVVEYVAGHPSAIGYVSMAQVTPAVKSLKVEGELPTPGTVTQGVYPLTRDLSLVAREPLRAEVRAWIAYCLSPAGQQIVGQKFGKLR